MLLAPHTGFEVRGLHQRAEHLREGKVGEYRKKRSVGGPGYIPYSSTQPVSLNIVAVFCCSLKRENSRLATIPSGSGWKM